MYWVHITSATIMPISPKSHLPRDNINEIWPALYKDFRSWCNYRIHLFTFFSVKLSERVHYTEHHSHFCYHSIQSRVKTHCRSLWIKFFFMHPLWLMYNAEANNHAHKVLDPRTAHLLEWLRYLFSSSRSWIILSSSVRCSVSTAIMICRGLFNYKTQ